MGMIYKCPEIVKITKVNLRIRKKDKTCDLISYKNLYCIFFF